MISELLRRLHYLLRRRQMDRELQDEMEAHREMMGQTNRLNFGSILRLREDSREAWGWMWLDRLGQDLHYGLRVLTRTPAFTITALLVLSVGIGINIAAFSLFDMLALRYMPVRDAKDLVRLERHSPTNYTSEMAYPSFAFYKEHSRTLAAAIAVLGVPPLQIDDDVHGTSASFVTDNYFSELGTKAFYGQLTRPDLDKGSGSPPVAVITYGLWKSRFGSNPNVIGHVIRVNQKPVEIIGVLPDDVATLGGQHPDLWFPLNQQPYIFDGSKLFTSFEESGVRMWGRLSPQATLAAAEAEMRSLTNQLRQQHPTAVWKDEFLQVSPGGHLQVMRPEMLRVAGMISVLTLLILTVACSNLGALLLARAVHRQREMDIRVAIGASAARIFRQLITESVLLAALGGAAALLFGSAAVAIALRELDAPKWLSATPNPRVFLFTFGISLLSAIFFGLAPVFHIARQAKQKSLARQALVTAQVAAGCVLLIVSGLLVRAAQHALFASPGFNVEKLVTIDPQMAHHGYLPGAANAYWNSLRTRMQALPEVRSTALVMLPPLGHAVSREDVEIHGRTVRIYPNWVTQEFFATMDIPLLLGRTFRPGDKNVVVVSQSFAQRQWPGQNPLGRPVSDASKDVVIGVVGDAHLNALSDNDAVEQYWPATHDQSAGMALVVRTHGTTAGITRAAKQVSASLDPKLFPEIRQIRTLYNENAKQTMQLAAVVSVSGFVAILLAGVGVIGLASLTVWQKSKEIAIRLAVGASRRIIVQVVLRQFLWPTTMGLLLGVAATVIGSRLLRQALFGVSHLDVVSYLSAILLLLAMLFIAAMIPTRRALRVNLSQTLHEQ